MRIIAGSAGGLPLQNPPDGVRPTMDRVRGAIFSSLGELVPGAVVLDLFAGSGAMGLEAMSRGASAATFVESDERCVRCIQTNLRRTSLPGSVQRMDAHRFLELYGGEDAFDLIFADPPYAKKPGDPDHAVALAGSAALAASLRPSGLFVLERQISRAVPVSTLELIRTKRYGGSEVLYFRRP
ncbi:MAG: 16S rRNA (guanine(966)-N(2))-methyltransferase RsmD [Terrimicrobiaceae bacterium]|nr:16S rRNA (guanine(966)-N(2))-methyltransferase RsmD [Terrimicrobiaceae bacterium]